MLISNIYAQLVESLWAVWERALMLKSDMRTQALKCTTMRSFHIFSQPVQQAQKRQKPHLTQLPLINNNMCAYTCKNLCKHKNAYTYTHVFLPPRMLGGRTHPLLLGPVPGFIFEFDVPHVSIYKPQTLRNSVIINIIRYIYYRFNCMHIYIYVYLYTYIYFYLYLSSM